MDVPPRGWTSPKARRDDDGDSTIENPPSATSANGKKTSHPRRGTWRCDNNNKQSVEISLAKNRENKKRKREFPMLFEFPFF